VIKTISVNKDMNWEGRMRHTAKLTFATCSAGLLETLLNVPKDVLNIISDYSNPIMNSIIIHEPEKCFWNFNGHPYKQTKITLEDLFVTRYYRSELLRLFPTYKSYLPKELCEENLSGNDIRKVYISSETERDLDWKRVSETVCGAVCCDSDFVYMFNYYTCPFLSEYTF
jgi:hypothetical protein